jgi:CheY-like chemotaxis protein/HPt (histidine-containing phosphotransfer) domain-containing protein
LLAEDDPINQLVGSGFLLSLGCSVDIAENGSEALRLLSQNEYHAVLMDCQMPQMDGFEATTAIRDPGSTVRNHDVPVIAQTAYVLEHNRDKCLAAGMNDYLTKPLDLASLAAVLSRWIPALHDDKGPAIFDESGLLQRHRNNIEVTRKIALLFVTTAPRYIGAIAELLGEGNYLEVQRQAHSLKGAAATVGANKLAEVAAELVDLCEHSMLDQADQIAQQLSTEFACLVTVLAEKGWVTQGEPTDLLPDSRTIQEI